MKRERTEAQRAAMLAGSAKGGAEVHRQKVEGMAFARAWRLENAGKWGPVE